MQNLQLIIRKAPTLKRIGAFLQLIGQGIKKLHAILQTHKYLEALSHQHLNHY